MKEADIRPKELMDRYLALSLADAQHMDWAQFVDIPCPGCLSSKAELKFQKNGFKYLRCEGCGSLFCSPRPSEKALMKFYETSASSEYWAHVFFPAVAESRREKLFRPKAQSIADIAKECGISETPVICDVGAGYGIFLEELKRFFPGARLCAVEPGAALAKKCRERGFETLETHAEGAKAWENRFDLVISSEVIEHVFSPEIFVRSLYHLVKPCGIVVMTGLGYEGFDILTLQEKSKSVFPPHHINFLSIDGFLTLFRHVGFRNCDVRTPGLLDADIVLNSGSAPEFLKVLAGRPGALEEFQTLLSKHRLSSHVWAIATK